MPKVDDDEHVQQINEGDIAFQKTFAMIDLLMKKKDRRNYWGELNYRKSREVKMDLLRSDKRNMIDKSIFDKLKLETEGLDENSPFTTENTLNVLRPEVSVELRDYNQLDYKMADKTVAEFQLRTMADFDPGNFENVKAPTEKNDKANQILFKLLHEDIVAMQDVKAEIADYTFLRDIFDSKETSTQLINFLTYLIK